MDELQSSSTSGDKQDAFPVIKHLSEIGGVATLLSLAKYKLKKEFDSEKIAQIWLDFFEFYNCNFKGLPGFESRYFKGTRVDLLIKIIQL